MPTTVAAAPSRDGMLRIFSEQRQEMRQWKEEEIEALRPAHDWSDYPIGVARELILGGFPIQPANLLIASTVPEGSGLSSSAALEVSSALAFLHGRTFNPLELALLCQRAERNFVGMPCGIMDQYISVFGRKNCAVEIVAPRERCYSHAIDDPACEINPRYFESLERYIEIFNGRGHVFEYYADAILFCGLGFATPAVVARDLRAYRRLGITSISCLTFGAYSVMAYPVNLEAFVRGSRDPDFEPDTTLVDLAAGRHPRCAPEMAAAYRAVERASKLCLDYGDVMRLAMPPEKAVRKRDELREAALTFNEAIAAADQIAMSLDNPLVDAEKDLWRYSSDVLAGLSDYLGALGQPGADSRIRGEAAIAKVAAAIERIRGIDPDIKGTWGAYDLEWIREIWLGALARGLDGDGKPLEELF